jgi:tetratricopeptide (TPR) repeat protein
LELGAVSARLGNRERAGDLYQQAFIIWQNLGNPHQEAVALFELGALTQAAEQWDDARRYYEASLQAAEMANDAQARGRALQALGLVFEHLGQFNDARRCYEIVFAMRQEAHDSVGQAGALNVLGVLEFRQRNLPAARDYLVASLNNALDAQNPYWEAEGRYWLGEVELAQGNQREASAQWRRALQLYLQLGRTADAEETQRRLTRLANPADSSA